MRRTPVAILAALAATAGLALAPAATGEQAASQLRSFQAGLLDGGRFSNCAVTTSRQVRCWGSGGSGGLGNGQQSNSPNPVGVSGLEGVHAVSGGGGFACALRDSGAVSCWGVNNAGQLGDGTQNDSSLPVTGTGLTDARALTAGYYHTCVLREGGTGACWGNNDDGQLGNGGAKALLGGGPANFSAVPVAITGLADARAIAAGAFHTCASLDDGSARCWGANFAGQLGNGTTIGTDTPVPVTGLTDVSALGAGESHTCALLSGGGVRCWGEGSSGRLGDGGTTDSSVPVAVAGLTDAIAIGVGRHHNCALRAGGTIVCWGHGTSGQLGDGNGTSSPTPVNVTGISTAAAVTSGGDTSCALLASGSGRCWGAGSSGQLGNGGTSDSSTPVAVPMGSIGQVADLAVGLDADPLDPVVGGTTTAIATVINDGPDPATSVSLAVPLPPGLQRLSHTASQGAYNVAAGFWAVGTLAPGQGETLELELRKSQQGTSTASVEVAASAVVDPDSSNDSAQLDIGTGAAIELSPQVRLFVTPRRDRFPRYRFALTALVDLPPGVQPAACTGTITYGFFFAPLTRLRAIRTREVIQRGNLCGFRFIATIPIGLTRAIFNSNRILVLRSLSRFDGNAQLQQTLSNNVFYGAG